MGQKTAQPSGLLITSVQNFGSQIHTHIVSKGSLFAKNLN